MCVTDEQVEAYLNNKGVKCIRCDSGDIEAQGLSTDCDGNPYEDVKCNNCHLSWRDEYKLIGATNIEDELE